MSLQSSARNTIQKNKITRTIFKKYYHDPRIHGKDVAKQLGVKEYLLPHIAKQLGVKTRKQANITWRPEPEDAGPVEERTYPHPLYPGVRGGCDRCKLLQHCTSEKPDILPCEVYVFFDERPNPLADLA